MTLYNPCIKAIGPKNAKVVFIGEAPGEQEELTGVPFIGASGQELDRLFDEVGLDRSQIYLTNVLFTRPPNNKLDSFCIKKEQCPSGYTLPPISNGKYLHPDLLPELQRLAEELRAVKPNLIIAGGGVPAWATLGNSKISAVRGTITESPYGKVLPTYHPAYLFRDWSVRTIIKADLLKAKVEMDYPEIRRPVREVLVDPTYDEVMEFLNKCLSASMVTVDVETPIGTITHLGFAPSVDRAIIIPFFSRRTTNGSYWSQEDEVQIRLKIGEVLSSKRVCKITQNGMFDMQHLLREGYRLSNMGEDTMLLQHALYPEMPKSLAFLGSIHTNETAWKKLRPRSKVIKRED